MIDKADPIPVGMMREDHFTPEMVKIENMRQDTDVFIRRVIGWHDEDRQRIYKVRKYITVTRKYPTVSKSSLLRLRDYLQSLPFDDRHPCVEFGVVDGFPDLNIPPALWVELEWTL